MNFVLDYGEQIHDGVAPPIGTAERVAKDIDALYNIFLTGQRAHWQLAVSPHTHREVLRTANAQRRRELERWFRDVRQYWREILERSEHLPTFIEAEHIRMDLLTNGPLDVLPDLSDRVLIYDAVVYNCDLFCTRDWSTILRHRAQLSPLPIEIVTPVEWWARVEPYAALFV